MVDLDPHQWKAINKLSTGKIIYGGVESGKPRPALDHYQEAETGLEAPNHYEEWILKIDEALRQLKVASDTQHQLAPHDI